MKDFIVITFELMDKMMFSPLVLLGLLITSLSLILTLKSSDNGNIQKFTRHKNIQIFVDKIFYTAGTLVLLFFISLLVKYFGLGFPVLLSLVISIVYILGLSFVAYNLFIIIYVLHVVVKTSLKDDK